MQDRVYRLAAGITGDNAEAEDIVQDLYEKLWRRRLLVAGYRNPEAYILTAARNLCLDRLRARRQTLEVTPQIATEDTQHQEGKDLGDIAGRLIAALPEKQRTVIRLRDVECMEIDEIAKVMRINESAVRMSLSRARASVKEQMIKIMNYGI